MRSYHFITLMGEQYFISIAMGYIFIIMMVHLWGIYIATNLLFRFQEDISVGSIMVG